MKTIPYDIFLIKKDYCSDCISKMIVKKIVNDIYQIQCAYVKIREYITFNVRKEMYFYEKRNYNVVAANVFIDGLCQFQ